MGFPACDSEMMLPPSLLLRLVFLLGYLRHVIFRAFGAVGLGDLLEDSSIPSSSDNHHHRPKFHSLSIQERLPAVRHGDTSAGECAVCLSEFEREEEVRRLSNCCHVFHRCCIDRWIIDHEQRTCPLCRGPIFSGETTAAVGGGVAGISESEEYYSSHLMSSSSPMSDSALFLPFFSSHY